MCRQTKPLQVKELQAVQLILDLPRTRIRPGARIFCLHTGKIGRVSCWHREHIISFPGGKIKSVPRHLLVEIQ